MRWKEFLLLFFNFTDEFLSSSFAFILMLKISYCYTSERAKEIESHEQIVPHSWSPCLLTASKFSHTLLQFKSPTKLDVVRECCNGLPLAVSKRLQSESLLRAQTWKTGDANCGRVHQLHPSPINLRHLSISISLLRSDIAYWLD